MGMRRWRNSMVKGALHLMHTELSLSSIQANSSALEEGIPSSKEKVNILPAIDYCTPRRRRRRQGGVSCHQWPETMIIPQVELSPPCLSHMVVTAP